MGRIVQWWMIANLLLMLTVGFVNFRDLPPLKAASVALTASFIGIPVFFWVALEEGE